MELWKKALVGVVAAVAAVAVLVAVGYLVGWLGTPRVTSIENSWGNVSASETELVTSVAVENPNPFNVKISSLHYTILLNNITVAEGWDSHVTLKRGTTVVDYISSLNMSRIPDWWSSHVIQGETTHIELEYTVKTAAGPIQQTKTVTESYSTVDTDLLSMLRLNQPRDITVSIGGEERRLLIATDFAARWGNITEEATVINATLDLYNPHDSAVAINAFAYQFRMNNLTVGRGSLAGAVTLSPYETTAVTCDAVVNGSDLIQWFTSHLENNETTRYTVNSSATFTYRGEQHTASPVNLTGSFSTDMLDQESPSGKF